MQRVARVSRILGLAIAIAAIAPAFASAQTEPSAADRAAAGEAYDRGTAAYLAHDYARAATLFETAYRLAPSAPALIQAIRAHEHADGALRAGSLALRLQALYGSDRQAARQATTTLAAATPQYLRIDVACDASCTIELDGTLEDYASFFVDPASPHTVRASFDTGAAEAQTTSGAAGETQTLTFTRPPPPPEPPPVVATTDTTDTTTTTTSTTGTTTPPSSGGGVHPAAFFTVLGLTLVSGGLLIWSGIDMYAGVPAYQANPTMAALQDGQARELRTDILWGVTGALAATSVILAVFTDWGGGGASSSESATPTVSFLVSPSALGVVTTGRF